MLEIFELRNNGYVGNIRIYMGFMGFISNSIEWDHDKESMLKRIPAHRSSVSKDIFSALG